MNLGVRIWGLKGWVGGGVRQWEFLESGKEGRPKHRETWASAHGDTSAENTKSQPLESNGMCPSTGLATPRARPRDSARADEAGRRRQPAREARPSQSPRATLWSPVGLDTERYYTFGN